jgi:hypothetical protein
VETALLSIQKDCSAKRQYNRDHSLACQLLTNWSWAFRSAERNLHRFSSWHSQSTLRTGAKMGNKGTQGWSSNLCRLWYTDSTQPSQREIRGIEDELGLEKSAIVGLGQETKIQSQVEIWQTLVQKPAFCFWKTNSTWTGWRMQRKKLHTAFFTVEKKGTKIFCEYSPLGDKNLCDSRLSPRITKTCQNQTTSSVTHMNDPYLW